MKIKRVIIIVLLVLFIADIIYITSFKLNAFNSKFYSKEFEKYNIYGEFPLQDVDRINSEVLDYLQDKRDEFDTSLFGVEEISHFRDVKKVIQGIDIYFYFALILSIGLLVGLFFLDRKIFFEDLGRVLFFSGVVALFFGVVVLVLFVFDFGSSFTFFHKVFFPQGGWLFSATDNIIKLYPSGLFYDIAKRIFIDSILYANILILAGVLVFLKND